MKVKEKIEKINNILSAKDKSDVVKLNEIKRIIGDEKPRKGQSPQSVNQIGKDFEYRILYYIKKLGISCERVPLSGSMTKYKGDLIINEDNGADSSPPFLGECKKTSGYHHITLNRAWLEKIAAEAKEFNKGTHLPILFLGFQRSDIYAVLRIDDFIELLKR